MYMYMYTRGKLCITCTQHSTLYYAVVHVAHEVCQDLQVASRVAVEGERGKGSSSKHIILLLPNRLHVYNVVYYEHDDISS